MNKREEEIRKEMKGGDSEVSEDDIMAPYKSQAQFFKSLVNFDKEEEKVITTDSKEESKGGDK